MFVEFRGILHRSKSLFLGLHDPNPHARPLPGRLDHKWHRHFRQTNSFRAIDHLRSRRRDIFRHKTLLAQILVKSDFTRLRPRSSVGNFQSLQIALQSPVLSKSPVDNIKHQTRPFRNLRRFINRFDAHRLISLIRKRFQDSLPRGERNIPFRSRTAHQDGNQ